MSPTRQAVATVIFDADDTLWDTQPLYEQSKKEYFRFMAQFGFEPMEVSSQLETTDHANVARLGFTKERFPQSMRDTYALLCETQGQRFDEEVAARAMRIGQVVFKQAPVLFEGVSEMLQELRDNHARLLLATKGDAEVQRIRIGESGLERYFHNIYILHDKSEAEFLRIIERERIVLNSGWSVGNSIKSDINPALAVGLKAIWIPRKTWHYESAEVVHSDRLYAVDSIRDVSGVVLGKR